MTAKEVEPVMSYEHRSAPFASTFLLMGIFAGVSWLTPQAATVVSGDVSGSWTTAQSPYILSANCTVQTNQVLTIEAGAQVIIGPGVYLNVYGGIIAVGTPTQPIFIQGTAPTNYWATINLPYSGFTNRFQNCRIRDSSGPALSFSVEGGNHTGTAEILQCEFINCGVAINCAVSSFTSTYQQAGGAEFDPDIHNCVFDSVGWGCIFYATWFGQNAPTPYFNPRVTGNLFKQVQWSALSFQANSQPSITNAPSRPVVLNNTMVNAGRAVDIAYSPCEPTIRNNLFLRNTNAIYRVSVTGVSQNYDTSYNCFFGDKVDFVGYPGVYGFNVQTNRNGDPCDPFLNLFLDPQVIDPSRFFLSNQSPSIDAGDPAISDECFTFSLGTAFSDIGAYGGPSACGWLLDAFAPRVEIQTFVGLSFTGLVNHTYSIEYVTNVNATNWTGLATNSLTQPVWVFIDTNSPAGIRKFYRVTLQR